MANVIAYRNRRVPRKLGALGAASQPVFAQSGGEQGLQALGVSGQAGVGGALTGAKAGASIGSVAGPWGTAIGAAVGAIVGGLVHFGTGAQRLATAQSIIKEIQAAPPDFQGRTLDKPVIAELYGALVSTGNFFGYVKPSPADSPSDIQHEFDGFMDLIAKLIAQSNATPIGATVNFSYSGWNGVHFTYAFQNFSSNNSTAFAQQVVIPAVMNWLTHNGAVDVANVTKDLNNPLVQTVFVIMTDWSCAQNPAPNAPPPPPPQNIVQQVAQTAAPVQVAQPVNTVAPTPVPVTQQIAPPPQSEAAYVPMPLPAAAQPVNVTVAAPASGGGMSTTTILIIGAIGLAAILLTKK